MWQQVFVHTCACRFFWLFEAQASGFSEIPCPCNFDRSAVLTLSLEEKYALILAKERQMAYGLAKQLIPKPETSVWMIFLPVLFVHHAFNIQRYKKSIHGFADNYTKTRKKALDLALVAMEEGRGVQIDLETCFPSLELGDEKDRKICEKQLGEIRVLFHHYKRLFEVRGKTWQNLVKEAYGEAGKYRAFLNELAKAEKEVTRYVTRTLQTSDAAREVAGKMEKIADHLREEDVRVVF
jgi:hypothetical protein